MKVKGFPKEILVYQCDEVDGELIYAVANNIDEIPEEFSNRKIGIYTLSRSPRLLVRRELK